MGRLEGKVAVITGASGGIGRVVAILFAKEGAKVVVASRSVEASEQTLAMARGIGGDGVFIQTDVSQEEDVASMMRKTVDTYGRLDVLYNNAAIVG